MRTLTCGILTLSAIGMVSFAAFGVAPCVADMLAKPLPKALTLVGEVTAQNGGAAAGDGATVIWLRSTYKPGEAREFTLTAYDVLTKKRSPNIVLPTYGKASSEGENRGTQLEVHVQPGGELMLLVTEREYLIYNWATGTLIKKLDAVTDSRPISTANHPSWSPDGKFLAFTANRSGTLKTFCVATGETHVLRKNLLRELTFPEWSPDGRRISVVEGGSHVLVFFLDAAGAPQKEPVKLTPPWAKFLVGEPVFYTRWEGDQVVAANNFRAAYYSLEPAKLLGTQTSSSSMHLAANHGQVFDAQGTPVNDFAAIGVNARPRPTFIHPEYPGKPSIDYRHIGGELVEFTYGRNSTATLTNNEGKLLYLMRDALPTGAGWRLKTLWYVPHGDQLFAIISNGSIIEFKIER